MRSVKRIKTPCSKRWFKEKLPRANQDWKECVIFHGTYRQLDPRVKYVEENYLPLPPCCRRAHSICNKIPKVSRKTISPARTPSTKRGSLLQALGGEARTQQPSSCIRVYFRYRSTSRLGFRMPTLFFRLRA
ncbi:MAG: hypothetical protein UX04_C0010G0012 [Microgenomates group bacterium GW2011_GWF2_45_18]|nr:MAG: hypothetical protein UW18_C0013G0003 [Microgenomates group bacterium GW2011_GWF1_44_10]KKU01359.1 MAG: hypothetical protein UX04_C0010G0012 [Microgenomates group bacterium GW2011_GWF2_45_18]